MPAEKKATTPNILLMMVDQMRWDAMGCAGNPHIQTPGLDRLAREGVRFAQSYSPVPVCIPARHGMLTGQRCAVHGRHNNMVPKPEPQLPYLAEILGLAGYRTHAIGKMHFRPVRRHHGFQRMQLMEEIPDWRADDEYLLYLKENGYGDVREVHGIRNILYHLPQVSVIPEEHHGSTWVADRTIDFLRNNDGRPFFLFSSWIAPHPPWNTPEPFASMYDPDTLPLPVSWDRDPATLPPSVARQTQNPDVRDASPEMLRRIKALYYGNISLIDKGVGRILDTLDELGLSGNTLVIFTTDHGEMLGDQHAFQKNNPYEPAAHIPFLARLPGRLAAGSVCNDLVSLLDVMPTCLDLAGVSYPWEPTLPGASILGRPGGGLAQSRDNLVIEYGLNSSRWLSLRRGSWRYSYYLLGGWEELYNLEDDPHELRNLLLEGCEEHRRLAGEMKAYLTAWEKAHGFSSSFDNTGQLRAIPAPPLEKRPINPQFPRWLNTLPAEERAQMRGIGESLLAAIAKETTVTPESLKKSGSLDAWKELGGSLAGTDHAHLLDEDSPAEDVG